MRLLNQLMQSESDLARRPVTFGEGQGKSSYIRGGTREIRLHPGSQCAVNPTWLVVGELLVETRRTKVHAKLMRGVSFAFTVRAGSPATGFLKGFLDSALGPFRAEGAAYA